MEMTTSSRYHLSPSFPAERRRISLAKWRPNFSAQRRTVVRDNDPARAASKSSTIRKRETKIKPDSMSNHFSWEPVAAIKEITNGLGHAAKSHTPIAEGLTLRCPHAQYYIPD
jgi:hypothetical protein